MHKRQLKSLPVLMHHLVSNDTTHISVRPEYFEQQCRLLAENGWFGVGLQEAEDFLLHGAPLPEKSFLLTFDDGYLDNYVHAWPIMRKYGHKGVVFAVTHRLDQAQQDCAAQNPGSQTPVCTPLARPTPIRPTLEDVWAGHCASEDIAGVDRLYHQDGLGFTVRKDLFMNWDEARLMEQSGVMAIAGHSLRHGSVFAGPEFSGFQQPGNITRTFLQTTPASCFGLPDFERAPELGHRAFLPNPDLVEDIKNLVPQEEALARDFFASPKQVRSLQTLLEKYKNNLGEYESPEAQITRQRDIMRENQAVLRRELGHSVRSFCWPWGSFCEPAREQGLAEGFAIFYTTRPGINRPGEHLAVSRLKVKDRNDAWLLKRLRLYSRPLLGALYLKMRL